MSSDSLAIRPGVAGVVFNPDGDILMHKRRVGHGWAPPSGAVEPEEDVRSALKRELDEEASLEIEITRFVGLYSDPTFQIVEFPTGEAIHFVTSLFVCRASSSQFEGSEEGIAWGWYAPEELPEPLLPYAERWLDDTIAEHPQPIVQ
ncbi:NUDIX hydrolase [Salinibacter altiplanensis]|uniref:NUDIX hydrolase n=1 Tax=Salinibacter altiplanensis TaxID=1803181 RepID=UPI000C9F234A|nr:NUDIX domain-containing protein [Salinibacter altiplanensis]